MTTNTTTTSTPARTLSVAEARAQRPRKRATRRSEPLRPMSAKQRRHNLSESNLETLRGNLAKLRERGVTPKRTGVPNGWAGKTRRKRLAEIREDANRRAGVIVDRLISAGVLDGTAAPVVNAAGEVDDTAAANLALRFCMAVLLAIDPVDGQPAYVGRDRLEAAKLVMKYTLPPPPKGTSAKLAVLDRAEAFVRAIVAVSEPSVSAVPVAGGEAANARTSAN